MKIAQFGVGAVLLALILAASAQAQNVGIGFSNPQSKLTVNGNVAIGSGFNGVAPTNGAGIQGPLFVGGTLANMTGYPSSGAGTYFFFDPSLGSIYGGTVTGTDWDSTNRGSNNAVFGKDNLVSGNLNLVGGTTNTVTGSQDLVEGQNNAVAGLLNIVSGTSNTISFSSGTASANLVVGVSHSLANSTNPNTNGNLVVGWQNSVTNSANSVAVGHLAVIPGGDDAFVFSDGSATTSPPNSGVPGQFVVRASGGSTFYSSSNNTAGVQLLPGQSSWSTPSDARLKENLHDLGYGLTSVLAMKPLVYNYKGSPARQKTLGFTAQEMQKIVPEVVDVPKNPNAMMGIRYSELIPVLAKAIQELKQEKDAKEADLENENAALKGQEEKDQAEIASLKAANQKLSTMATKVEALEQAVAAIQQSENGGIQKAVLAQ
jgi:Chaperone of endosialidase